MSEEEAVHHYCRSVAVGGFSRLSLKEKSNYDCIFWENGRCLIYKARPLQCASYPFWAHHLYSEAVWKDLEKSCPGINKGRKHSMREINGWLEKRRKEPFINTGTIDESAEL